MVSKILLGSSLICVLLLSGCIGFGPETLAFANPLVKDFMSEYPNAQLTATHYSVEESEQILETLSKDCGKEYTEGKDIYRINIDDPDSGLKVVAWVNMESQTIECVVKYGNDDEKVISDDKGEEKKCKSHAEYKCKGDHVYWVDSCGNKEEKKQYCNNGCEDGECIGGEGCESQHEVKCYDGHVYWYDSCGNREEVKQYCGTWGCENRSCKGNVCVDSDGRNYQIKGTVTFDGEYKYSFDDLCSDAYYLKEMVCRGFDTNGNANGLDEIFFKCPGGCENGICSPSCELNETSSCIDSDDYMNIYESGNSTYPCKDYGFYATRQDYCLNSTYLYEFGCRQDESSTVIFDTEKHECPYGCIDGACLSGNECEVLQEQAYTFELIAPGYTAEHQFVIDGTKYMFALNGWNTAGTIAYILGNKFPLSSWEEGKYYKINDVEFFVQSIDINITNSTTAARVIIRLSDCLTSENETKRECTDSDGGINLYEKGTANDGSQSLSDHCNSDGTLTEKYCAEDGTIKWDSHECPEGYECSDGACLSDNECEVLQEQAYTFELISNYKYQFVIDGTKYKFVLGGWNTAGTIAYISVNDFSLSAWEEGKYYKINDAEFFVQSIDIINITNSTRTARAIIRLSDCLTSENETKRECTDSDGGKNYYVKGTTTNPPPQYTSYWTDECVTPVTLQEGTCIENLGVHTYDCPNGCKDGKCINETSSQHRELVEFPKILQIRDSGEISDPNSLGILEYGDISKMRDYANAGKKFRLKATIEHYPNNVQYHIFGEDFDLFEAQCYEYNYSDMTSDVYTGWIECSPLYISISENDNYDTTAKITFKIPMTDTYNGQRVLADVELYKNGVYDVSDSLYVHYAEVYVRNETINCTDSDGGKDYFVKGHVNGIVDKFYDTGEDFCGSIIDDGVYEAYCDGNDIAYDSFHECEYGCYDGACLKEYAKCTDTDISNDHYNKGYITIDSGKTKKYDFCGYEQGSLNQNLLLESYCGPYKPAFQDYYCSNGCNDGLCLPDDFCTFNLSVGEEKQFTIGETHYKFVLDGLDSAFTRAYLSVNDVSNTWEEGYSRSVSGNDFIIQHIFPTGVIYLYSNKPCEYTDFITGGIVAKEPSSNTFPLNIFEYFFSFFQ